MVSGSFMVALQRARGGNGVKLGPLSALAEHERISRNMDAVRSFLKDAVPQADALLSSGDEMLYLSLVLSQCLPDGNEENRRDPPTLAAAEKLVTSALEQVRSNYHVDFFRDQTLIHELSRHVAANYDGYLLGLRADNPLFERNGVARNSSSHYHWAAVGRVYIAKHRPRAAFPRRRALSRCFSPRRGANG